jgi:hypothetical protein
LAFLDPFWIKVIENNGIEKREWKRGKRRYKREERRENR